MTEYREAQVRYMSTKKIRIQIFGKDGNNGDFWEWDPMVSDQLAAYVKGLPTTRKSLAKTDAVYAPILVKPRLAKDGLKVRIHGPEFNRPYGASFVLPYPEIGEWLAGAKPVPIESEPDEPPDVDLSLKLKKGGSHPGLIISGGAGALLPKEELHSPAGMFILQKDITVIDSLQLKKGDQWKVIGGDVESEYYTNIFSPSLHLRDQGHGGQYKDHSMKGCWSIAKADLVNLIMASLPGALC